VKVEGGDIIRHGLGVSGKVSVKILDDYPTKTCSLSEAETSKRRQPLTGRRFSRLVILGFGRSIGSCILLCCSTLLGTSELVPKSSLLVKDDDIDCWYHDGFRHGTMCLSFVSSKGRLLLAWLGRRRGGGTAKSEVRCLFGTVLSLVRAILQRLLMLVNIEASLRPRRMNWVSFSSP
jgi:hypothetical protein